MSVAQTNYSKILQQFKNFNYNEESTLHQRELKQTLDTIVSRNASSMYEFNSEVAEELWTECDRQTDGTVKLKNFISVVVRAQSILKQNIGKAETQLSVGGLDVDRKRDLQESLAQYHQDLRLLSAPFNISLPAESRMSQKVNASMSRASYNPNNPNQSGMQASGFFSGRSSGIFADVPSKRQTSNSLKITFIITIVLFLIELIICFNKTSFFNILVYLSIFAIVLMGYFDKYYMKFVLFSLVFSIILDFIWIIVLASPLWNPVPPTTHSTLQTPFIRFQFSFVVILMLAKVVLVILFFRYRNNDESMRKVVIFWGNTFEIDGRVKQNNPISRLLSGRGIFGSTINQQ